MSSSLFTQTGVPADRGAAIAEAINEAVGRAETAAAAAEATVDAFDATIATELAAAVDEAVTRAETAANEIEQELAGIDETVGAAIDANVTVIDHETRLDAVDAAIPVLESRADGFDTSIASINASIASHGTRITNLEAAATASAPFLGADKVITVTEVGDKALNLTQAVDSLGDTLPDAVYRITIPVNYSLLLSGVELVDPENVLTGADLANLEYSVDTWPAAEKREALTLWAVNGGSTDNQRIEIVVNEGAVGAGGVTILDDTLETHVDTPSTIDVLGNDTIGSGPFTVYVVVEPTNGTATVSADNTITYTPDAAFVGDDSFTYVAISTTTGVGGEGVVSVTVRSDIPARTLQFDEGTISAVGFVAEDLDDSVTVTNNLTAGTLEKYETVVLSGEKQYQWEEADGTVAATAIDGGIWEGSSTWITDGLGNLEDTGTSGLRTLRYPCSGTDHGIRTIQKSQAVNDVRGAVVRYVDSSNYMYARFLTGDVTQILLGKVVSGTASTVQTAASGATSFPATLELSVTGDTFTVKVNGSTVLTRTEVVASTQAGTQCGHIIAAGPTQGAMFEETTVIDSGLSGSQDQWVELAAAGAAHVMTGDEAQNKLRINGTAVAAYTAAGSLSIRYTNNAGNLAGEDLTVIIGSAVSSTSEIAWGDTATVALGFSLPADTTSVEVVAAPTRGPLVGADVGGAVPTPLTVGATLTKAEAEALIAERVLRWTYMSEPFTLRVTRSGGPDEEHSRTFRMDTLWYGGDDQTRWDDIEDAMNSYGWDFASSLYSRAQLSIRWNNSPCDWRDSTGAQQGTTPYVTFAFAGVGAASRTMDVTAFVAANKTTDSSGREFVDMVLTGRNNAANSGRIFTHNYSDATKHPKLTFKNAGVEVASITPHVWMHPDLSSTSKSDMRNSTIWQNGQSSSRYTGPRPAHVEWEIDPSWVYDTVELTLHQEKRFGTGSDVDLYAADHPGLPAATLPAQDATLATADILYRADASDLAAILSNDAADDPGQPGSRHMTRTLDAGRVLTCIPRYDQNSNGSSVIELKARTDQPYYTELWLRQDEYVGESVHFHGGWAGKGGGSLACTYMETSTPYDPDGSSGPIPPQWGGMGGGRITEATWSARTGFGGRIKDGERSQDKLTEMHSYTYVKEYQQDNVYSKFPRPVGCWHTKTVHVRMNTFNPDGTPNADGLIEFYFNDYLAVSIPNITMSTLPNFGIREVNQLAQWYVGGTGYESDNPDDRAIHIFGVGNVYVSTKPLGLDPVTV